MDNQKTIKDRITGYLKDAVRAVQVENVETVEAIGSKETTNAICYAMEAIFLHGLKGTSTNKNFWPLVKKFTHKATLSVISELSQISTDVGKCRAWIRLALNDGALDSYCKVITSDTSTIRNYYDSSAYFRDVEQCNAMETHLQGLCNFMFDLAYNSTVLNQWTTTALVLSGLTTAGHLDWPTAVTANDSSNQSALDVNLQHRALHSRSPISFATTIPISSSCPQGLSDAAYDSSFQLSQSEIDAIRSMSSAFRDCSETPVSMLSRPDFTENHPAIYAQLAYAITSDSDQESVDPERADEERDMRFERIVRTNLDRYPLDYDRNQTTVPEKTSNSNVAVDRVEDASDVGQLKYDDKADRVLCNPFDEGKPKVMSYNPFEDDRSTATDCSLAADDKKLENPKIEEPKLEVTGSNPFEEEKSDVVEQNEENVKVADVESVKTKPAVHHRRSNCVRVKGGKDGEMKRGAVRQVRQRDDSEKVGQGEASSRVTEAGEVPLAGGSGVTHEVRVLDASNRIEQRQPRQMGGASDEVVKLDHSQSHTDDIDDDLDLPPRRREESFNTMLNSYIPSAAQTKIRTLDAIIDNLPHFEESGETVQEDCSSSGWASSSTVDDTYDSSVDDRAEQQAEFLFQISVERGLSQQCYQCRNCARAIGMFYDQDRVCAYDGYHYCHECHENKEHCIPGKVVYNWDFRPYKVSNLSFEFLQKNFETPLLDIERLNFKLYGHVKPLDSILTLRTQLRFVKSYMMTCTQAVGLEFMEKFDDQSYLFDKIHLYSLKDLTLVPSGALQKRLQKIVKFATGHVYGCPRCCQKGFYCEICRLAKVIYPFETSSTFRCRDCKAVYHNHCKTHLVPCPKCKRMSEREHSVQKAGGTDPIDSVDYSYQLENGSCHQST